MVAEKSEGAIYTIRWAKEEEWVEGMDLVWRTFMEFDSKDYCREGIRNFYDFISDIALYESFKKGTYQVMVALNKEKIIGLISMRNTNYLSLLFVDGEYHKKGVGSALIDRMCSYLTEEMGEKFMSLRATPYAVGFYKKIGFIEIAPEEVIAGIRVTPMEKYFK